MASREPRTRRKLTPEEKWQAFLEVTAKEITQADAARKYRVDVSTIITLRRLAKDAAMAAFASAKPGRPTGRDYEIEDLKAENARLSDAIKELAIEGSLVRGKQRSAVTVHLVQAALGGIHGLPLKRSMSAVMAGMLFLRVVDR